MAIVRKHIHVDVGALGFIFKPWLAIIAIENWALIGCIFDDMEVT